MASYLWHKWAVQTSTVSLHEMKHDQKRVIARVRRGEIITLTHRGRPVAILEPATERQAPSWDEIMAPVRAAMSEPGPTHPNPVLAERARRRR